MARMNAYDLARDIIARPARKDGEWYLTEKQVRWLNDLCVQAREAGWLENGDRVFGQGFGPARAEWNIHLGSEDVDLQFGTFPNRTGILRAR